MVPPQGAFIHINSERLPSMQKVSGSAWEIYNTSTDRQYLVSYYMNRQAEARSILLSQEFFFIFGIEQTPDFLPCPSVS